MRRLIAERLGHLLLVLWVVATLTFLLFRMMPGDPTLNFLSPTFTDETRAALLKSFGLDKPLWEQYLLYMGNLLRGDFGRSFLQDAPVASIPDGRYLMTMILTCWYLSALPMRSVSWLAHSWHSDGVALSRRRQSRPRLPRALRRISGLACWCWRCSPSSLGGFRRAARSVLARRQVRSVIG